jgi:hypothetical protein
MPINLEQQVLDFARKVEARGGTSISERTRTAEHIGSMVSRFESFRNDRENSSFRFTERQVEDFQFFVDDQEATSAQLQKEGSFSAAGSYEDYLAKQEKDLQRFTMKQKENMVVFERSEIMKEEAFLRELYKEFGDDRDIEVSLFMGNVYPSWSYR